MNRFIFRLCHIDHNDVMPESPAEGYFRSPLGSRKYLVTGIPTAHSTTKASNVASKVSNEPE